MADENSRWITTLQELGNLLSYVVVVPTSPQQNVTWRYQLCLSWAQQCIYQYSITWHDTGYEYRLYTDEVIITINHTSTGDTMRCYGTWTTLA